MTYFGNGEKKITNVDIDGKQSRLLLQAQREEWMVLLMKKEMENSNCTKRMMDGFIVEGRKIIMKKERKGTQERHQRQSFYFLMF